jgi:hypothetical protein
LWLRWILVLAGWNGDPNGGSCAHKILHDLAAPLR